MRNQPQPGEYLFVGGPADGRRQHVKAPTPMLHTHVLAPLPALGAWNREPPETAVTVGCTYRLERIQANEEVLYFYVHAALSPFEAIAALLEGYRLEQRMRL